MHKKVIPTEENYRTDKTTRILMLFHQLLNGQSVDKLTYSIEHGVTERTFDRDIEEIRLFLSDICSGEQLIYDRESNKYYLSGSRPKYIDRMDVTVISKLILESKTLRKDEMNGLLDVLLSAVSPYDAKMIEEYLAKDIWKYTSNIENAILKFVGDLYAVLKYGYDIEVMLKNDDGKSKVFIVSPLEIVCEHNAFYLVAAQKYRLKSIIRISLDKIFSFKCLHTTFAHELKEKYYKTKEE